MTYQYDTVKESEYIKMNLVEYRIFNYSVYRFKTFEILGVEYLADTWRLKREQKTPLDMYRFNLDAKTTEDNRFRSFPDIRVTYDFKYIRIVDAKINKHTGKSSSDSYEGFLSEIK
ncbi:MAG TPA: hypothetical protein VJ962_12725 [Clostridia bacterium]|nr:hypothetical protein [Clostridia bacterium]